MNFKDLRRLGGFGDLREDFWDFLTSFWEYLRKRTGIAALRFETVKGILVDFLMAKRGRYSRPFLNLSLVILVVAAYLGAPIIASSYPGTVSRQLQDFAPPSALLTSLSAEELPAATSVSEKPRDQVITYKVQKGETLSQISQKFGITVETIKWANDLKSERLSLDQELKIPPVTGVVHKVRQGETVYLIAQKYKTDAQKIVNFPFNDFVDLDTFALSVGQTLIVPDGVMPEAPAIAKKVPVPVVSGPGGQLAWPTGGSITQYPVWYHMALDIANKEAPGIASSCTGKVSSVEYLKYAYGHNVIINCGEGITTLYAHLSDIYVKTGDSVSRGQILGRMGSTGRSTGTHLHFEVRKDGMTVNPLPYLK